MHGLYRTRFFASLEFAHSPFKIQIQNEMHIIYRL
jgi:hypothetical protein